MEKVNLLHIYPNELEMFGDPIQFEIGEPSSLISFKTKISMFEHAQDDPLFQCAVYTTDNSMTANDCIQEELLGLIEEEIGCQPPLLAKDHT